MEKRKITDLQKIKKIELDILSHVAEVCERNHLTYYLAYGTLLGAVRHGGFIPWDDDIDIWMPRKDYEKLCDLWGESEKPYRLLECSRNHEYVYPFAKVFDGRTLIREKTLEVNCEFGIYIDIFPYDGLIGGFQKNRNFLKRCERIEKLRVFSMSPMKLIEHQNPIKNIGRKLLWHVLRRIGPGRLARALNRRVQRYSCEEADWAGSLVNQRLNKECVPKKWFAEGTELEFEGRKYRAPKEYHKILTTVYGDYMQLPPEEERVLKHDFQAWELVKG